LRHKIKMNELRIEKAMPNDVPQIIALVREFAEYENLSDFCEVTQERLSVALFGETKVAEAIILFEENVAIGYAIFYPNFASFRGQCGFYLEDIYIKDEFRGRGAGEMMLKYIAKLAQSRGFERIDFQVLEWNAPAIEFYEKLGAKRDEEERHFKFTDEAFKKLAE
jgi:ribosomal protein S18 acetylase RimI-like enzyme